ncbi:MAG: cell division protein FtsA [Firmicutes bacterium]|jgi:cell division protein FtsA|nr:cell division protein FtsA [Bacillota bacterium]
MSESSIIAGIDIGTTRVTEVIARLNREGQIDVLGVGEEPCQGLRRGLIIDIDSVAAAIAAANKRATRMAGVNIRKAFVGVPVIRVSCATSRGMTATSGDDWRVTATDVRHALNSAKVLAIPPDREIISVLPQEYIVDGLGGIRSPEGMTGIRLEVITKVITGQVAILENITESIERAGLIVEGRVLEPIAAAQALLTEEQTHRGVMLIDIGGQVTQVVTFYEGTPIQLLCVPIGGMHITNDISIGMKVSFDEAEKIKEKSALDGQNDTEENEFIRNIIDARLRELIELIESETREIRGRGLVPCGVVFAGAGAFTPNTTELACEILDLPAEIGKPRPIRAPRGIEPHNISQVALGIVRYVSDNSGFLIMRESQASTFEKVISGIRGWFDEFVKDFF